MNMAREDFLEKLKFWQKPPKKRKVVKILAMDGGGIRGIIPAIVLAEIERRTQKPIAQLFDLVAGTSTGGIIALGMVTPDINGQPKYNAKDILSLYEDRGKDIFTQSSVWRRIKTVGSWIDKKYLSYGMDTVLADVFGETRIADAVKEVIIPSYEIEKRMPYFFKSHYAKQGLRHNYLMREVARATAAAPTYFSPIKIEIPPGASAETGTHTFIDGGVFANNPSMCAYVEAQTLFPDADDYLVVSIGTGELLESYGYQEAQYWGTANWIQPLFSIVFHGNGAIADHQMQMLLPPSPDGEHRYFRFQTEMHQDNTAFDEVSEANLESLKELAYKNIIYKQSGRLNRLCELLIE